jgi:hypothetical protein
VLLAWVASLAAPNGYAQAQAPGADRVVDAAERQRVIDATLQSLKDHYVYLDGALKMAEAIRAHCAARDYDNVTDAKAFAEMLTTNLRDISHDSHLSVQYDPLPNPAPSREAVELGRARELAAARRDNFRFSSVRVLAGNVGYLEFRGFSPFPEAKETCIAAMNFLANTDALIIDLRPPRGGSTLTIDLMASYLFDGSVHLYDVYFRDQDRTDRHLTAGTVAGPRFGGAKPLFILTSRQTISGTELFASALRGQKRAILVGETTRGGAHHVEPFRIDDRFVSWVPNGRHIVMGEKTDWEGTGIEPDLKTEAALALNTAHLAALEKLLEQTPAGEWHDALVQIRAAVEKDQSGG